LLFKKEKYDEINNKKIPSIFNILLQGTKPERKAISLQQCLSQKLSSASI